MTLISKLVFKPQKKAHLIAPVTIKSSDISIVIPVRNNQKGINLFLSEFFKTQNLESYPQEIIIVDNQSKPEITIPKQFQVAPLSIRVIKCSKLGPASARNMGIKSAQGDWILFTDSDCIPSESLITGYLNAMNGSIGYAGNVKAWSNDVLSNYYETQEILVPLKVIEDGQMIRPEYLITANALVWKKALEKIGGFNETIKIAAGEDIDLGFRLLEIGNLSYSWESTVYHDFTHGIIGFIKRFIRYGKGNKLVSQLYSIDLTPQPFIPNKPGFINQLLSTLQYVCLIVGYRIIAKGAGNREQGTGNRE